MQEREIKRIKKVLEFESSGETLSIEIEIKNVSPVVERETIISMLDSLYENTKIAIF
jgi:hypothetical protein